MHIIAIKTQSEGWVLVVIICKIDTVCIDHKNNWIQVLYIFIILTYTAIVLQQ